MILLDANILLYAVDSASPFHTPAKQFLETALSGTEIVGFPWESINAFLRISTNHRIWATPLTVAEATNYIDEWLDRPCVRTVIADDKHWQILRGLIRSSNLRSDLVMDGHIAAYALTYDATLVSTDADFQRFKSLRLINPCSLSA